MSEKARAFQDLLMIIRCFFVGHNYIERYTKRAVPGGVTETIKTIRVCICCEREFLVYDKDAELRGYR